MRGLMQDWPLLCHRIIEHAAAFHGTQEVVTRSVEGPIHRTTYAAIRDRALKVSQRLDRDGIKLGDRVATIAWNTWRHVETCTASWASVRSAIPSIRDCSPTRSPGSSTTPRIAW